MENFALPQSVDIFLVLNEIGKLNINIHVQCSVFIYGMSMELCMNAMKCYAVPLKQSLA